MNVLAIDIGGTKIAAAAVNSDGRILARHEVLLAAAGSPDRALTTIIEAILARVPADELQGVGIGSAGPLDVARGAVSPINIPAWRDHLLVDAVAALLPDRPVRLAGDAQCMALGEWWRGAALDRRSETLLGIVVSTGVGGGWVLDGVPYLGCTGNAGHIGHIAVDLDGDRCSCGSFGCVETIASGPSMTAWARRRGWNGSDARALALAAAEGHPIAVAAFGRAADALATAILTAAVLMDLDRVVIGGGVAAAGSVLFGPLGQAVADRNCLPYTRRLRIGPTTLGRDAGLLGAAALALAPSSPALVPHPPHPPHPQGASL
ncbi:ROK family protein [Herbidospora cretacea]|uniref:ROK family protein n=1 Tax=Herbidospora cretacea TaxID=28444 RepID=UPI0007C716C7|nr:ROK family protein [Herbidospora cretacea]